MGDKPHTAGHGRYRVMLTMEIVPGRQAEFEQAWRAGMGVIADHPANLAHSLSRSTNSDTVYFIVSDWTDEGAFREFERSDSHLEHRASLHPFRAAGAMTTMHVVGIAPRALAATA